MSDSQSSRRRGMTLGRAIPISALPKIIEAPFPERRTLHWLPPDQITMEDFSIVVTSEVILQTSKHVAQTLEHERGGFLLGNRYQCPNTGREYIIIDQYVEADFVESTDVSLTFTLEAWGQLEDKLTGKYYGKQLVGWYHSHPSMSIFLSEHDLVIHQNRFNEPWMVALVLEPKKHLGGFFVWNNGKVDPNHFVNFYELLEGDSRASVVAWKNYNGVDPLHGKAPTLRASNSENPDGTEQVLRSDPHDIIAPPPESSLPDWLHGNVLRFGGAALAIIVFVIAFLFFVLPKLTNSNTNGNKNDNTNQAGSDYVNREALSEARVKIDSTGKFDDRNNTITLKLSLSGLPHGVAKDVRTKVKINNDDATTINPDVKADDLLVTANLQSQNIARKVGKSQGGQYSTLQISYSFEYKGKRFVDDTVSKLVWLSDPDKGTLSISDSQPEISAEEEALREAARREAERRETERRESERREAERKKADKADKEDRDKAAREEAERKRREQQNENKNNGQQASGRKGQIQRQIDEWSRKKGELEAQLKSAAGAAKKTLKDEIQNLANQIAGAKKKLKEKEN